MRANGRVYTRHPKQSPWHTRGLTRGGGGGDSHVFDRFSAGVVEARVESVVIPVGDVTILEVPESKKKENKNQASRAEGSRTPPQQMDKECEDGYMGRVRVVFSGKKVFYAILAATDTGQERERQERLRGMRNTRHEMSLGPALW